MIVAQQVILVVQADHRVGMAGDPAADNGHFMIVVSPQRNAVRALLINAVMKRLSGMDRRGDDPPRRVAKRIAAIPSAHPLQRGKQFEEAQSFGLPPLFDRFLQIGGYIFQVFPANLQFILQQGLVGENVRNAGRRQRENDEDAKGNQDTGT